MIDYAFLYSNFYLKYLKKELWEKYTFLLKSQNYTREELDAYVNKKIKRLVKHVEYNVPFYRDYMKRNKISHHDINTADDLKEYFPVIDKEIIIKNYEDFISDTIGKIKVKKSATSGSSGKQLFFYKSLESVDWSWAVIYRYYSWFGVRFGDKQVALWGRFDETEKKNFRKIVSAFIHRKIKMSAYKMTDEQLMQYAMFIKKYSPALLRGYASALYNMAVFLEKNNISINGLKGISSTSDMLTENMRNYIQDVFNTKVYNQYACGEIQGGAMECEEQNGLHIAEEHNIYEVDSGEEEEGNIIITDLDNYAMPFIRYKNGDRGIITSAPCTCGRSSKRLLKIVGRSEEFVVLPDGRRLNTTFFSPFFSHYSFIKQFQIVQENMNEIVVNLVSSGAYDEHQKLKEDFYSYLGKEIKIYFEFVDKITLSKSGKYPVIINKTLSNA